MKQKISRLTPRAPPENGLVERNWRTPFLRCFCPFFFILGELCPGLVLVSSPVAKCTYKQHRYRNKCIATGPIYAWALSASSVSPPLSSRKQVRRNNCICAMFLVSGVNYLIFITMEKYSSGLAPNRVNSLKEDSLAVVFISTMLYINCPLAFMYHNA